MEQKMLSVLKCSLLASLLITIPCFLAAQYQMPQNQPQTSTQPQRQIKVGEQYSIVGEWFSSMYLPTGDIYNVIYVFSSNGQVAYKKTDGTALEMEHQYKQQYEYKAPFLSIYNYSKLISKRKISWENKDEFTALITENSDSYYVGLQVKFVRLTKESSNQVSTSPQRRKCTNCNGTGVFQTCQVCGGTGQVTEWIMGGDGNMYLQSHPCYAGGGCHNGKLICMTCSGRGYKD